MTVDIYKRMVRLANGAQFPLGAVASAYGELDSRLRGDQEERQVVFLLRQFCLGCDLDQESVDRLRGEKLVCAEGSVEPVMKQVVLASVRGEGCALFLASPFTDSIVRHVAEFIVARNSLRSELPAEEAEQLLSVDRFQDALHTLRALSFSANRKECDDDKGTPPRS